MSGRGGFRPGAGRPKSPPALKKVPVGITLPPWLIEWMGRQEKSRAVLIEESLRRVHGIQPPAE